MGFSEADAKIFCPSWYLIKKEYGETFKEFKNIVINHDEELAIKRHLSLNVDHWNCRRFSTDPARENFCVLLQLPNAASNVNCIPILFEGVQNTKKDTTETIF